MVAIHLPTFCSFEVYEMSNQPSCNASPKVSEDPMSGMSAHSLSIELASNEIATLFDRSAR